MRFRALAVDYDGTLAHGGIVATSTCEALAHLKRTGRRIVLVTGRELGDLKSVCRNLEVFDRVVAENGAVVYNPADGGERVLGEPPPRIFVERLEERRIAPLSKGRVIVATSEPHEKAVLDVIRDLGLELQIVFNEGAVMVLPAGMRKASGLQVALVELGIAAHEVVGVGDAENDHALMQSCGCAVAVADALPMLKGEADRVLESPNGAGIVELVGHLVEDEARLVPAGRRDPAGDSNRRTFRPEPGPRR